MLFVLAAVAFMVYLVAHNTDTSGVATASPPLVTAAYTADEVAILNKAGVSAETAEHHHYMPEELNILRQADEDWALHARGDVRNRLASERSQFAEGAAFDFTSAKFTWGKIDKKDGTVCGTVDSKNVEGQYTGPKKFVAERAFGAVHMAWDKNFDAFWKRNCE